MPVAELTIKVEVPDPPPDEWLVAEDGVPLESDWHRLEINLLVELAYQHFAGRTDYFAGGNMFIYFNAEQARNKDFRGPDFFFVWGAAPAPPRQHWTIWKEGGLYPNTIIELLSPSTAQIDRTTKKDVYEQIFRTPEYYCYDPDNKTLEGWRLKNSRYQSLTPDDQGRLWCEQLELWLGVTRGAYLGHDDSWLRFFRSDGTPVPTVEEAGKQGITRAERRIVVVEQMAALAEQKAASAEQKAASAEEQAALARQQAEEERRRAEAALAELARLKAQIESKNGSA